MNASVRRRVDWMIEHTRGFRMENSWRELHCWKCFFAHRHGLAHHRSCIATWQIQQRFVPSKQEGYLADDASIE